MINDQKIINLLKNNDIESKNLLQKSGILVMIKIMDNMVREMKMILLLNLKLK